MKRRTFIITVAAATTVFALPAITCTCKSSRRSYPVVIPDALARFCDDDTIKKIGSQYLLLVPSENKKDRLENLILTDDKGERLQSSDNSVVHNWIDQKITQDFKAKRIVIIDGWMISETEARQCALFSLVNK